MKIQFVAAFGAVGVLSACGGSSSGVDHPILPLTELPVPVVPTDDVPAVASTSAALTEASAALSRATLLDPTPLSEIPDSGTASLSGILLLNDAEGTEQRDASVSGAMTVVVDFSGDGSIEGTATNFRDLADTAVGGELVLSDGQISTGSEGGSAAGTLTGRLTDVGRPGTDSDFDYALPVAGLLVGDNVEAIQLLISSGEALEVDGNELIAVEGATVLER